MPINRQSSAPNYRQALAGLLGLLLGLGLFITLEHVTAPRYNWVTPLDQQIPFIAQSWWLYVLFFPFVLLAAAYASAERFRAFKNATVIAFCIALLCFWLFPELIPRPDTELVDNGFLQQRLRCLWQLDLASNGCPSLHVTVTCLACRALWDRHHRWLTSCCGLLICLSTLTLKQHTVIDVIGGLLLALICALLTQRQGSIHAPV
ncbi:inositol phosphorylceramide synthase [Serratia sp. S1B]|nr:inositol phosphorylceramide synthase [Serratia sp. S1B]